MVSYDTAMMHFSRERIEPTSFETRNGVEADRREMGVMMIDDGLDKCEAQHETTRRVGIVVDFCTENNND
jgi:hypothetical protein